MAKILINDKNIYYEVHGEGEPLIILNGIMMSTTSWQGFVDVLAENNKLILLDFIDQGQSDKSHIDYNQDIHVETLVGLLDYLDINKVHMVGISYGGEVAMKFSLKYQERLNSLTLANTTSYTNHNLKDIGKSWINAAKTCNGSNFFKTTIPVIYSTEFYEENIEWLRKREELFRQAFTKEWYEGFIRLTLSAEDLNVTEELENIKVPTLIIGSEEDIITPIKYQQKIHDKIKDSRFAVIKEAGHASMYEKPYEFLALVLGFIKVYNKEIKIS
ncbi:alpha/beta hydrolase [Clostridium sp. D2Q-11]|uniref:Alpha/beta hydrolase n=1 Tax=Anaeromonas frigoriresistens TaxID=2683708 RepID=A0A942UWC2_9FIRM|nr:alpha/beta hydrolase [Anaeromonas frigoriresistens]MBS4537601.1 alpha/beta hydrolase [Anaeromonas frigoriresistens]